MADFKTFSLPFDINTQSRTDSISAGVQFRSQDVGTAKLIFNIFKDGIALDLTDDTIKLNIRTADGSLFQLNGTVDDPENGVASCVLSSDVVTHYGTATAELVILYTENQSLSVSQFTFDIEQSIVDQDITPSATYYIQNLQDFMGAVNDILGPLTDNVNTQIDLINQNQVVKLPDYNADKADTAAQLANKANQTYVDQVLASLTNGGPDEIFYSISALNTAYPSGANRTKLVFDSSFTDGAHSFLWNGTSWQDIGLYQGIAIGDRTVTPQKTSFISDGLLDSSIYPMGVQSELSDNKSPVSDKTTNSSPSFDTGSDDSGTQINFKDGMDPDISFTGTGDRDANLAVNGNFSSGTTGWSLASNLSVSNNILSATSLDTTTHIRFYQYLAEHSAVGRRIFLRMEMNAPAGTSKMLIRVKQGNGSDGSSIGITPLSKEVLSPTPGTWYTLYAVFEFSTEYNDLSLIGSFESASSMQGLIGQARNVVMIDMGSDTSNPLYNLTADQINTQYPSYYDGIKPLENLIITSKSNQMIQNGDLSAGTTNWYSMGNSDTLSINGGILSAVGNGGSLAVQPAQKVYINQTVGRRYFIRALVRTNDTSVQRIRLNFNNGVSTTRICTIEKPVAGTWYALYGIYEVTQFTANTCTLFIAAEYADATTANGKSVDINGGTNGAVCLDLGNEGSPLYDLTDDALNARYPNYIAQKTASLLIRDRYSSEDQFTMINGIPLKNGNLISISGRYTAYTCGRTTVSAQGGTLPVLSMSYLLDIDDKINQLSNGLKKLSETKIKASMFNHIPDLSGLKEYNPDFSSFQSPLNYAFRKQFSRRDWYNSSDSYMLGHMDLSTNPFNHQSNIYNGQGNFSYNWENGSIVFSAPYSTGKTMIYAKKYFPFSTEELGIDYIKGNARIGLLYGDTTFQNFIQVKVGLSGVICAVYVNGTLANQTIFSAPDFTGCVLRVQNTGRSLLLFRVTASGEWDWIGRYWYKTYLDARQLTFLDTWKTFILCDVDTLTAHDEASFNSFSSRLASGANSVSIRFLTYEDGTFIQKGNYMYYLVEGTGTTIGDLFTQICRINFKTSEVQMIGGIFQVRDDGTDSGIVLGDDSIKAVYDRNDNKWKMISCGMEYADEGYTDNRPKIYSETTSDLLEGGIIIIKNGKKITFPGSYVEDIDFYYDASANNWRLIGNTTVSAVTFRTADNTLTSAVTIETTGPDDSVSGVRDTGNQFVKFGATRYITSGGTANILHLRDDNLSLLGSLNLDYPLDPSTTGPWCTLCPYKNGDETELYLLTFDRSDLLEGKGNGAAAYDHGGLYVYKATV